MSTFSNYSKYYDLLYKDKNYFGEVEYVHSLLQRYMPKAKSILELGCGTGLHASLLVKKGYNVHGIDISKEMIESAKRRLAELPELNSTQLSFDWGDARCYRANHRFDAIISLFHVMSYQTTNEDLQAVFETIRLHLRPQGVFIFDYWYGPAVLTNHPVVRIKRFEDGKIHITRIAEPVLYPNKNLVDVNYDIIIQNKQTGKTEEIKETHRMRYLFIPELEHLLSQNGLSHIIAEEWVTGKEPGLDTWGVCSVARL